MMPQTIFDDPDGTLAMLRDSVAGLAVRHPGAATLRARRAAGTDLDMSVWTAMAEAGWTGLLLPEELGGTGLGLAEQAVLSEALGRALITEPLAMSAVFAGVLLSRAPQTAERDRLAAGLADGSAIIASAWQDAPSYSRAAKATATASASGFVISGEKHFVEAATSATDFLVVAETPEGAALFSVPAGASGVTVETRDGVDGASIGSVAFSNCQVSSYLLLARAPSVDSLLAAPILHARLAVAAELAGIACRALEITIAYTKDRVQFGKPIASFQAIQHRLVEMWSDAEFACASVVNAVEKCASGNAQAGELAVLAAKARAGDAAYSICRRAVHLHGAMGFTDESDIGLYLKRAINLNFTLGQPEALRLQFVELERAA
jgi:alkylation response protein AidB-like acyl-CoA dehydrogenase